MADEKKPETSPDEIEVANKRKTRDIETRISVLEDENQKLRVRGDSLQKLLDDIVGKLKSTPVSPKSEKSFWDQLFPWL